MPIENASVCGVLIRGACACKRVIQPPKFIEHFDCTCVHSFIRQILIKYLPRSGYICTLYTNVHIYTVYPCVCVHICVYIHTEKLDRKQVLI